MFTEADYLNGWLAYGAGAIVGLWCWWYMLSKLPIKPLRPVLVGIMVGFLLMPWYTSAGSDFLAPAWLVAASEGLFDGPEHFWRAGSPLIVATVIAALLGFVVQVAAHFILPPREKAVASQKATSQRANAKGQSAAA